jgi:hypothetical protein
MQSFTSEIIIPRRVKLGSLVKLPGIVKLPRLTKLPRLVKLSKLTTVAFDKRDFFECAVHIFKFVKKCHSSQRFKFRSFMSFNLTYFKGAIILLIGCMLEF